MNELDIQPRWNKQIEFFSTLFITWKKIAFAFQIDEEWDLSDPEGLPTTDIVDTAFREASKLIDTNSDNLDENRLLELENKLIKDISQHWSADNVIPQHLDIAKIIAVLNAWSTQGPKNKKLFPVEPVSGTSMEFIINKTGINITIYPPFMIPFTELYYTSYDELPECNLIDLTNEDITETLYLGYVHFFGQPEIDLSSWDEERNKLSNIEEAERCPV